MLSGQSKILIFINRYYNYTRRKLYLYKHISGQITKVPKPE